MESKIKLKNIKLFGFHGVSDEEKKLGQKFEIDVEIIFKNNSHKLDVLAATLDYSLIYDDIKDAFYKTKYNLIEHLAHAIINRIFSKHNILLCKIIIRKPSAPINAIFDSVEIEVLKDVR